MDYSVKINEFEGPLDLLLHLIKSSDINIADINVSEITNQYLEYLHSMKKLNLNIDSEYLIMAAELIEMKSRTLLPQNSVEEDEENPRENLISRLVEYQKYKDASLKFNELEIDRKEIYTRLPNDLNEYRDKSLIIDDNITLNDLLNAFSNFFEKKEKEKPLNTSVTQKEYSVAQRSNQIKKMLKEKKRIEFTDLFEKYNKSYVVVTFLSILELAKNKEIQIEQTNNFNKIYLLARDV